MSKISGVKIMAKKKKEEEKKEGTQTQA